MGKKSYWFEGDQNGDQKGNFSNNGKDTFDPKKSYTGIRLQQGVPLLDRDWNELEDIRRYQEMMLRKTYLGNGTPDDGFKISACNPAGMDFQISYGRFLVDGFEAVNGPHEYTNFSKYTAQKGEPALKPLSGNEHGAFYYTVYLDLWIDEITASEEPALNNSDDIKICTSVRHRIQWRVKVVEWLSPHERKIKTGQGHYRIELAKIKRSTNGITDNDITDLRSTWRSLEGTEQRFKSIINELLRGNIPSEPEINLIAEDPELLNSAIEIIKIIYVSSREFWLLLSLIPQDTTAGGKKKKTIKSLRFNPDTDDKIICRNVVTEFGISAENFVCDSLGKVFAFWQEEVGGNFLLYSKAFIAESYEWGILHKTLELPSAIKNNERLQALRDYNDTIYHFWIGSDNGIYHAKSIGFKPLETPNKIPLLLIGNKSKLQAAIDKDGYIYLCWMQEVQIMVGTHKELRYSIHTMIWHPENNESAASTKVIDGTNPVDTLKITVDKKGRVWLFWKEKTSSSILYKNSDDWSKDPLKLVEYSTGCYSIFIDAQDVLWVLFQKDASKNIWCKRFINGEWMSEMRLLGDETAKTRIDMLNDQHGDNWLFWQSDKSVDIWCKKCYGAL